MGFNQISEKWNLIPFRLFSIPVIFNENPEIYGMYVLSVQSVIIYTLVTILS